MKEITTEIKVRITMIAEYDDESAALLLENSRNEEQLRKLADGIKETLVADKVDILNIKNFERDMTDEEVME